MNDRRVLFMAHPVAGDVSRNLLNARRWLRWLMLSEPEVSFVAPWLTAIDAGADDADGLQRERGIRDNEAVLVRCDGIVLVGGRISTGMRRELALAEDVNLDVDDLTYMGTVAPVHPVPNVLSLRAWIGPANDEPGEVSIEIGLAEALAKNACLWEPGPNRNIADAAVIEFFSVGA